MSDENFEPEIDEEPRLPGAESEMDDKPDWRPRYEGSDRLKGKVAIVTGADSGIGRAVAALFAREGADIVIVYYADEETEDATKTKSIVEDEGRIVDRWLGDGGSRQRMRILLT